MFYVDDNIRDDYSNLMFIFVSLLTRVVMWHGALEVY